MEGGRKREGKKCPDLVRARAVLLRRRVASRVGSLCLHSSRHTGFGPLGTRCRPGSVTQQQPHATRVLAPAHPLVGAGRKGGNEVISLSDAAPKRHLVAQLGS